MTSWCVVGEFLGFFFFKQKTAYDVRISDWSSDVCSSDLNVGLRFTVAVSGDVPQASVHVATVTTPFTAVARIYTSNGASPGVPVGIDSEPLPIDTVGVHTFTWTTKPAVSAATTYWEIGRASCRERVCQYV